MSLSRWLLIKIAGAFGLLPHQRVRRYKVTLFGESLGTFTLPIGDHMENPNAPVRPVLTKPFRMALGEETFFYWVEPKSDGFKTVEFHPPSPELRDEAVRFYSTAHGLNADGAPDPARQPPLSTRTVEETRFIRAILQNRGAEQPYADYAAWLSARGDSYGDYIRLTLELEKLPEGDTGRARLEERREKLVAKDGPRWALPLANIGIYPGVYIGGFDGFFPTIFHNSKGVIEELDVDSNALVFPTNAPRLFYAAPFLRNLSVNNLNITVADIGVAPQMAQIESLALFVGTGTADDYRHFAESPHLNGLHELQLVGYRFGPEGAAHLASARWMSGVQKLDIGANAIGDAGAEALAESPYVTNLNVLELGVNYLNDRGLTALCRSAHLARLTVLHVARSTFTATAVREIPSATFAHNLRSIDLMHCGLDFAGARALADADFPALKSLMLAGGEYPYEDGEYRDAEPCGDAALQVLVAAPWFRRLERFYAIACGGTDATAGAIAELGFVELQELLLGGNQFTDAGVAAIVRSKAVTKLKKLNLSNNPFGAIGVSALAETDLPALEEIDLTRIPCGPAGAKALAASPHLKNLKKLWISEEHIGLIGRETLLKRFGDEVMTFIS
ncbi:leucine-rich repeat domain-containing protein [Frigoriglobus tundricola]|uniref:Uncharacterized protein n=1 Tax=Frigoriglobus tundricola TaxID=2774151 RepID=A0A6M5Z565_9BACT|nr:hypothetical protein [Frigoriglobus tundricola]QJX00383.1 hypothetical protein FTUN_8012 [Frigoriglobus tundricola]